MEYLSSARIYVKVSWGGVHANIFLYVEKGSSLLPQPPTHWYIKETNKETIYYIQIHTYKCIGKEWYRLLYKEIYLYEYKQKFILIIKYYVYYRK